MHIQLIGPAPPRGGGDRPFRALRLPRSGPAQVRRASGRRLELRAPATTDIVDVCMVEAALRRRDLVVSPDEGDLRSLAASGSHLEIDHP